MNTHFCLIWLFKLERQGRIILKIQISLGSILNLPQIKKILAIWAHKLNTPWFSLLPRKRQPNADTNYMEMQRPSCIWRGQCTPHSFTWSEAKECDQGLRLLPYLMLIEFFFLFLVRILFQGNDYLNFFFFFFSLSKLEQEQIGSDGSGRVVEDSASHVMCLWAQSETSSVPAHATVLCLHCRGWLVSSVMRAIRGLCRLV